MKMPFSVLCSDTESAGFCRLLVITAVWVNIRRPRRIGRSFGWGFVQNFLNKNNQILEFSHG